MVAVERISQYSDLPSEAPLVIEGSQPPPSWPQEGTIMLQDLKVQLFSSYQVSAVMMLETTILQL